MNQNQNLNNDKLISIIIKLSNEIRKELNLKQNIRINIAHIKLENKDNKTYLVIYAKTRSDKSLLIGPGGWVIGKLREKLIKKEYLNLKDLIIIIKDCEESILIKRKKEKLQNYLKSINLKEGEKIGVLVQCNTDLDILNYLKDYYSIIAYSYNCGTFILPNKNINKIKEFINQYNNIEYKIIDIKLDKSILKYTGNKEIIPCNVICKKLTNILLKKCNEDSIKYIFINHYNNNKYVKEYNVYIINFLKLGIVKISQYNNFLNCPLLIQHYKKNKESKKNHIKNIVKNTYNGLVEPTKATEEIMKILNY